jgi:Raf kinase inhibitor-like YbhB/YbcL family protein
LYNLPFESSVLPEAIQDNELFLRTLQGVNSWDRTGYGGPCPPIGRHRYFFKLYALNNILPNLDFPDKDKLLKIIQGHVLAETKLMDTYQH